MRYVDTSAEIAPIFLIDLSFVGAALTSTTNFGRLCATAISNRIGRHSIFVSLSEGMRGLGPLAVEPSFSSFVSFACDANPCRGPCLPRHTIARRAGHTRLVGVSLVIHWRSQTYAARAKWSKVRMLFVSQVVKCGRDPCKG